MASEKISEELSRDFAMNTLSKDYWYFFEVYPRDLERPQWRFVGTLLGSDGEEFLLSGQAGQLYFITFPHFEIDEDFVSVRCEVARAGDTIAELEAELKEVFPSYKRPTLLERFIGSEEPLESEKPNKDYEITKHFQHGFEDHTNQSPVLMMLGREPSSGNESISGN